ncbi:STR6 [Symbiodinium natans]|uniref:STR6 protein n=1 Tax=Symbiodinium natans TaxID=878477 RepID=A0A812MZK8_9DINO|nr:STR6 [Symbiodinium natans]
MEFAQEAMAKHAPIDGMLLGFSQGSNLCHPLAASGTLGQGHPLHCVVHLCSNKPGWVGQTPELFEYQLPLPALIVEGKVDEVAKGSDEAIRVAPD